MEAETKKYVAYGVLALGLLALVASLMFSGTSGSDAAASPQDSHWICQDAKCQNTVTITRKELAKQREAHPGSFVPPCPKCGKNTLMVANKCPHCGTFYAGGGRARTVCPKCGKPPTGA